MIPAAAPIVCAWVSLFCFPAWLIPLSVVMLFLAVLLPCADRRENLWMLVLSIPTLLPINIRVLSLFRRLLFDFNELGNALLYIVCMYILLSAEELILQYLTRLIWKKQYSW